jgi:hypothetical protein
MDTPDKKATKDEKHRSEERKGIKTKYEGKNLPWKEINARVLTCKLICYIEDCNIWDIQILLFRNTS